MSIIAHYTYILIYMKNKLNCYHITGMELHKLNSKLNIVCCAKITDPSSMSSYLENKSTVNHTHV